METQKSTTTNVVVPTPTITPTTKELFISSIAAFVPSGDIPKDQRKTTKDKNGDKNFTPNAKCVLGVNEEDIITWAYPAFTPTVSEELNILAKEVGMTSAELLTSVVRTWVHENHDIIRDIAGEVIIKDKTPEDFEKEINKAQEKLARMIAALNARKGKITGDTTPTTQD